MQQLEPLACGKFYHIYNRGINGCDIFNGKENCEYFLNLYDIHLSPIADTFAWVLMKNHFHLLVRIKNPEGFQNLRGLKLHQPFSNLFNAYAKAYNKQNHRTGSLFEHPFHRKLISGIEYFKSVVIYIHNNPVHHGITESAMDYPWSSYLTCISVKPTHLQRDEVMGWFDNTANFITAHCNYKDDAEMGKWLGL
jgi:putative transposase